jgi:hypothetical protein
MCQACHWQQHGTFVPAKKALHSLQAKPKGKGKDKAASRKGDRSTAKGPNSFKKVNCCVKQLNCQLLAHKAMLKSAESSLDSEAESNDDGKKAKSNWNHLALVGQKRKK